MLNVLTGLAASALGGGAAILLLTALAPFLSRRFAPGVRLRAWKFLAALMLFVPYCMVVFPRFSMPHPVRLEAPRLLVESAYRGMDACSEDRTCAQDRGYSSGSLESGFSGFRLNLQREDGGELVIEDNLIRRTVTENGVRTETIHWTTVVFLGWLIGALLHAGLVWGRYLLFRRRTLRWAVPARAEDLNVLADQKKRLNCPRLPELYCCPLIHTPLLMGVRKPVILLPEHLPESALGPILAHELTHLKEGHLADKRFFMLFRAVYWFNPLAWWMVRRAGEDMELCCDYALTCGRNEEERREYGMAILNQLSAGRRAGSSLTTGFSGNRDEVFRRFRAIADRSPRKRGRLAIAFLACGILLSQSLVSCQSKQPAGASAPDFPDGTASSQVRTGPSGELLVLGTISQDQKTVTGQLGDWADRNVLTDPLSHGWQGEQTWPLAEGAELRYAPGDDPEQTAPLNPATIEYSIRQSQYGRVLELTINERGEVTRVVMRGGVSLDLSAADLDFTGFTGTVYAEGMTVFLSPLGIQNTVRFDPCAEDLHDEDNAVYELLLAEDADIPAYLRSVLNPLSSAGKPALCALELLNGRVNAIREQRSYDGNPELALYRNGAIDPPGIGDPFLVDYFSSVIFNEEPEIQIHSGWEPVYQEGDSWSTLTWDGLSAICYFSSKEGSYAPYVIDTTRDDLLTYRGIRVGDTRRAVLEAYPELEEASDFTFWGVETEGQDMLWYNLDGSEPAPEALLFFFQGDKVSRIVLHFTMD